MLNSFVNFIIDTIENFANTEAGMIIGASAIVCCSFGIIKKLWSKF